MPLGDRAKARHYRDKYRMDSHLLLRQAKPSCSTPYPPPLPFAALRLTPVPRLRSTPLGDRAKERHYRDKYPRWWIQSYLAGVPTLVAGARDRAGKLLSVRERGNGLRMSMYDL